MGCLLIGVAALLALAIPASIAPATLIGAYVVLAVLAALAAGAVLANARRRAPAGGSAPIPRTTLTQLGVLIVGYAVVVAVIHVLAN